MSSLAGPKNKTKHCTAQSGTTEAAAPRTTTKTKQAAHAHTDRHTQKKPTRSRRNNEYKQARPRLSTHSQIKRRLCVNASKTNAQTEPAADLSAKRKQWSKPNRSPPANEINEWSQAESRAHEKRIGPIRPTGRAQHTNNQPTNQATNQHTNPKHTHTEHREGEWRTGSRFQLYILQSITIKT